ncbi:MAG: hypothetical protein AAFX53_08565 [Bacteroidota bacterium]
MEHQQTPEIVTTPQRPINRLEVFTNEIGISNASINRIPFSEDFLEKRKEGRLLTHYVSDGDDTELRLHFPKDSVLELTVCEASNDLLENPLFTIPPRPTDNISMPFVMNDAILTIKTIRFE